MSEGLNQVTLLGNLGADPELRHNQGGSSVLQLRLATTETYLDKNKVRQETTEWHTVVVWGRRGEGLARILSKGSKIAVTGALRTSSWETNTGEKRYRTQIVARNVLLCGGGPGAPRSNDRAPDDYGPPDGHDFGQRPGGEDDDIPF